MAPDCGVSFRPLSGPILARLALSPAVLGRPRRASPRAGGRSDLPRCVGLRGARLLAWQHRVDDPRIRLPPVFVPH